ncbi:MAG TPA: 8-oxo-dGTP diphosphatase [Candidatus Saccharimonadales bacterium]|nr:8-oxo-dGTP diphosphatase [Candidatus Saccharimonadales bacterium]
MISKTNSEGTFNFMTYRQTLSLPLRQASLCFLVRPNRVLLAMKKRGFGQGFWNGVGGKVNAGEAIETAAIRETEEEIKVTPTSLRQVATLNFYFPHAPAKQNWDQQVIVYLAGAWQGEPAETEEMAPRWFDVDQLPFEAMWQDDRYWLPQVLAGHFIKGDFAFDQNQRLLGFDLTEGAF